MSGDKSVLVAYILWLFGGIFGVHHFYLRRDRHAFVWWTTLGGYGVGWLNDITRIPRYVREANEIRRHMDEVSKRMHRTIKPPFSMNRFTGMLMVGYSWGQMTMSAIPPDEIWGFNLVKYMNLLVPLAAALGVWTVGNIGREKGSLKYPLFAAYLVYPLRYFVYDETIWFTVMVLTSALAFDSLSKEWRRKSVRTHFVKRIAILGVCAALYLFLWCSYLYYHGAITDSEGEEVPVYEAFHHFFTSPWWLDVKQCLLDTYTYAQHHGWYEVWKQIIDLSDPHGEQNAYRVLGVGPDSSQQEITSTWRRLSRENHPDKVKDESLRRAAQEKFMEIQQAYEILSKSKHRRNRRNKKDNSEPSAKHDEM